jgi:predicted ATPase
LILNELYIEIKDYLISLRGYEIYPQCLLVTEEGKTEPSDRFVFLKVKHKNKENLGFQDVGRGISYVFPILSSLWQSKLSFIEQPELHLHPSAQCELGDVFIASYNKGSMAVVESHSEHMLLRILRRIRETTNEFLMPKELKFTANDLRIYYFKPEPDGFTTVKEIRVDEYGELLNTWPGGFFSERDRELFGE